MFNTAIIEVVVGLIFVFSLMAILVTQINNVITTLLNTRANELKRGLEELLTDPQVQAKVLAHPLIKMVKDTVPAGTSLTPQLAENIMNSGVNKVEWIESATFVEALTGVLLTDAEGGLYYPLQMAINGLPSSVAKSRLRELLNALREDYSEETLRHIVEVAAQIKEPDHRNALLRGVQNIEETLERLNLSSNQLVPLLNGINKIDNPQLKGALQTILATAHSVEDAEHKIAAWFDDSMNRVSALYKRKMQLFSFISAFLIALLLNVDTLHLGRTLWEDPELRQEVAAAASEFDQEEATSTTRMPGSDTASQKDLERQTDEVQTTIQTLLELQLPVGWQYTEVSDKLIETSKEVGLADPRSNPRNAWNFMPGNNEGNKLLALWFQKLLGLIATTIAAAQGAPFWFDILNKLARRGS